jgi:NEDD4-binding protein 2
VRVYILRGLPGSGKSDVAKRLAGDAFDSFVASADNFFVHGGVYRFDAKKLGDAHAFCQRNFVEALKRRLKTVVVDNTNTRKSEYEFYVHAAEEHGYQVSVVSVKTDATDAELAKRNKHGCPEETIRRMRERWED